MRARSKSTRVSKRSKITALYVFMLLLLECLQDELGEFAADHTDFLNGLWAGCGDGFDAAEMPQQCTPALGTDAGDVIERRMDGSFSAATLMIGDGEPMRLIPNALQQEEGWGIRWEDDRVFPAGDEKTLVGAALLIRTLHRLQTALGDADQIRRFNTQFPQYGLGDVELAFAAVHHD